MNIILKKKLDELSDKNITFEVTGYSSKEILISFYRIKKYIEFDDKESLAKMIIYPLTLNDENVEKRIYTPKDFISYYDRIITPSLKNIVLKETEEELFYNWSGAMFGDGQIWFGKYITQLNNY